MAETLDSALRERLGAVLDRQPQPVSETELRKLFEEGRVCTLILSGQLEGGERQLAELAADPASSLAEFAAAGRTVNELRPDLDELRALLAEVEGRAREFRASWLKA